MASEATSSLYRNRDFTLLWIGQVLSDLGGRVSGIAFPLLVLAETHSPAKAGLVASAGSLPLLVLTLPAGAIVDRFDRKRLMIGVDAVRFLALASLAAIIASGRFSFPLVIVVALVDGAGFVLFNVAERSALPSVVVDTQLEAALGINQGRDYAALLGGQPLGGVLFSLARVVPFIFDAASYLVSVVTLSMIRTRFRVDPSQADAPLEERVGVLVGLRWFWRQRALRATGLFAMGSDFVLNALYLVIIVIARRQGASPAIIGILFFFLGGGGILGSFAAPWLARRLSMRALVVLTPAVTAALLPLLIVAPVPILLGVIYGAMIFLFPAWNVSVGAYRLRITPNELQGRVASIATMLSLGPVAIGGAVTGYLLATFGTTTTCWTLTAVMAAVTLAAAANRSVRNVPRSLDGGRSEQADGADIPEEAHAA